MTHCQLTLQFYGIIWCEPCGVTQFTSPFYYVVLYRPPFSLGRGGGRGYNGLIANRIIACQGFIAALDVLICEVCTANLVLKP